MAIWVRWVMMGCIVHLDMYIMFPLIRKCPIAVLACQYCLWFLTHDT